MKREESHHKVSPRRAFTSKEEEAKDGRKGAKSRTLKLSSRLEAVARLVPQDLPLADVGTDHAYLLIHLVQKGQVPKAIGIEVNEEPWRQACAHVAAFGLEHLIELRLGWGLKPLRPGEVKVVTIAGLGGRTIQDILSASPEVLQSIETLVLQPQGAEASLRRWLADMGWRLKDEELVYEGGQYYTIDSWERGANPKYGFWEWEFGPLLLLRRHPLLTGYLKRRLLILERIEEELERSGRTETLLRREEIRSERQAIEEVLACL